MFTRVACIVGLHLRELLRLHIAQITRLAGIGAQVEQVPLIVADGWHVAHQFQIALEQGCITRQLVTDGRVRRVNLVGLAGEHG